MDKKIPIIFIVVLIICGVGIAYYSSGGLSSGGNTTITDMANRTIEVPASIESVIATSPPMTVVVYMIAPEKLVGLNFNWTPEEITYVPEKYQNISVIGGWFGRQDGNYEEMISVNPDIVIEGSMGSVSLDTINERQKKFGEIPVVGVTDASNVTKIEDSIKFTGKLLGNEDTSNKLVEFLNYYLDKIKEVDSTIEDSERVTVYYANGPEGLETGPVGSSHSQLIDLCGGINVADLPSNDGGRRVEVSIEQVIKWNPEVIITVNPTFYKNVYNDPKWANIDAVKNKRVYLSPTSPFKWFDQPPGANVIIGIPWTAKILYPEKYTDINMKEVTKQFYKNFYHYDLSDEEVSKLLKDSGFKEENF